MKDKTIGILINHKALFNKLCVDDLTSMHQVGERLIVAPYAIIVVSRNQETSSCCSSLRLPLDHNDRCLFAHFLLMKLQN